MYGRCGQLVSRLVRGSAATGSRKWMSTESKKYVAMWGNGDFGRLGLGDFSSQWKPTVCERLKGENLSAVSCGGAHTLFLTEDGRVFATGMNDFGQLGIRGIMDHTPEPCEVAGFGEKVVKISAGYRHSAAITVFDFDFQQLMEHSTCREIAQVASLALEKSRVGTQTRTRYLFSGELDEGCFPSSSSHSSPSVVVHTEREIHAEEKKKTEGEQAVAATEVAAAAALVLRVGSRLPNLGVLGKAEYLTLDFTQPRMSALPLQRVVADRGQQAEQTTSLTSYWEEQERYPRDVDADVKENSYAIDKEHNGFSPAAELYHVGTYVGKELTNEEIANVAVLENRYPVTQANVLVNSIKWEPGDAAEFVDDGYEDGENKACNEENDVEEFIESVEEAGIIPPPFLPKHVFP
ncbi:putative E3 ubiquitin-protein ligase [Nymphaea thermarum]|nr:putative E3 ubiquitin-protein ligase [Nymphaea thermarum]